MFHLLKSYPEFTFFISKAVNKLNELLNNTSFKHENFFECQYSFQAYIKLNWSYVIIHTNMYGSWFHVLRLYYYPLFLVSSFSNPIRLRVCSNDNSLFISMFRVIIFRSFISYWLILISDIICKYMSSSNFAILILSGEDFGQIRTKS